MGVFNLPAVPRVWQVETRLHARAISLLTPSIIETHRAAVLWTLVYNDVFSFCNNAFNFLRVKLHPFFT